MPRKFFIACLIISTGLPAISQKTLFSFPLAGERKNYSVVSAYATNEADKTTCVLLKDNNTIQYFLFSPDLKLISKIVQPNGLDRSVYAYNNPSLLGTVSNNNGFNFIYSVKDKSLLGGQSHIRIMTVNFEKSEVSMKNYFAPSEDEVTIQDFANHDKYYHITANDKTDELIIYILDENGKVERKNIRFNLKEFYDAKKMKLTDYFSFSHSFHPSEETGLKQASDLSKFFFYPDKIVITVQNDKEPPHLLDIDLKTFNLTKRKLDLTGFCGFTGNKETFYNNSYIFDGHLYVLNVCKDMLEIGIFDPNNGSLLKKIQIPESDDSFFADNATYSRSIGKSEKEKELKTKELIKRLMKGSLAIAPAKNINGNIILSCGTYDEKLVGGGGYYVGGFSPSTMPAGNTYSGSNVPVMRPSTSFNAHKYYNSTRASVATIATSFRLVLDSQKLVLMQNQPINSKYDEISDAKESFQPNAQARNFIDSDGKLYACYYDTDKKEFLIQYIQGNQ